MLGACEDVQVLGGDVHHLDGDSQVGAGTTPTKSLPTWALRVEVPGIPHGLLGCKLRTHSTPVCGRVQNEGVILDLRTFLDGDEDFVIEALDAIAGEG